MNMILENQHSHIRMENSLVIEKIVIRIFTQEISKNSFSTLNNRTFTQNSIMSTKEINKKNARFDTRLSREQKEYFEKASRIGGYRSLTDFVVVAVQEKAHQIISEKEQILASERDSELFFDALLNPKAPNKALSDAAEEFKALFSS